MARRVDFPRNIPARLTNKGWGNPTSPFRRAFSGDCLSICQGVFAVHNQQSIAGLLKNVGLLALLGFGVVVLAGPLIGLLSVVLSFTAIVLAFAFVGFMVWALFQALFKGQRVALDGVREIGIKGKDVVQQYGGKVVPILTWPFRAVGSTLGGLLLVAAWLFKSAWVSFWFVAEVALVAAVGVLVGAAVGWTVGKPPDGEAAIVSNAVLGGALAATVGLVLTLRERLNRGRTHNTRPFVRDYRFRTTPLPN